jgi:hypothetical protein
MALKTQSLKGPSLGVSAASAPLDEERTESEVNGSVEGLRRKRSGMEPLTRRPVEEQRQGRDRYSGGPQWTVLLKHLGVVGLLVGRAAGRVRLIGRHPLVAAGSAGNPFRTATRFRAAVILLAGTRAFRRPSRNVSRPDKLADTHARRHEQRPTCQEENQHSEHAVKHRQGTSPLRKQPPSNYIRRSGMSTRQISRQSGKDEAEQGLGVSKTLP